MKKATMITTFAALTLGMVGLNTTVLAAEGNAKTTNGEGTIKYKSDTKPVDPVDPEKPVDPVDPGEGGGNTDEGDLRVDFVSHLRFGEKDITSSEGIYMAAPTTVTNKATKEKSERGNYVQVTDKRAVKDGKSKGWTLQAKLNQQFQTTDAKNKLTGSTLTYMNPYLGSVKNEVLNVEKSVLLTEGNGYQKFVDAKAGQGWGTYTLEFGRPAVEAKEATMDKSIQLNVPANTPLSTEEYKAQITWTIAEIDGVSE